jgi:hypothetical protein
MSTNIIPANIKVPAHLAARIGTQSALAQSMTGGIGSGVAVPRISIKGARFRIVDGDTETVLDSTKLSVIVVGANPGLSKTWYAKAWTPDADTAAPDCYSLNGISPHPDSEQPQNDMCATCPQNAWGSKITPQGQKIKACADQKRLAIVAADDPDGPVYLLQVTPAALRGLNQYQKELTMRGIPPEIVATEVSFDTDASFPKLKFSFGGFLDEDQLAAVDKLFGSQEVLEVTGEAEQVATKPAPAPAAKPAAKPAPQPEPEPEPEPETAKPTRGFGATKAKPAEPEPAAAAPKATKAAKPAPTVVSGDADSLADEIAALIGDLGDDDA